jgi:hypothetical protein
VMFRVISWIESLLAKDDPQNSISPRSGRLIIAQQFTAGYDGG